MGRLTLPRLALLWATVVLLPSFAAAAAWAQGGPIRIIVGTAPGGAIEPYARVIAEHMARTLGQPIIIENKPGASGNIAAQYIVDQPADGSIIWLGTQAFAEIAPNTFPNARWSIDQFHPIIRGVEAPLVFVTAPSVPAGNLAEFIAWAKANRGKLGYSSYQAGTPSHFLGFQMNEKWDLDLTHVPYRGSGLQVTGLSAAIHSSASRSSTLRWRMCAPASSMRWRPPGLFASAPCRTCRPSPSWVTPSSPPRSGSGSW
jgi:tripartite-type tricarboxylate transporter receptor subunit TctC